jgi:hypothetical protein
MNPFEEFNQLLNTGFDDVAGTGVVTKQKKLGYVIEPDKITLSFSRNETLRKCPRKFLLREIQQRRSNIPSIDTAYGHAFGTGLQEMFRTGSIERTFVAAAAAWDFHEFEDPWGKKKDKSLWMCLWSLELFHNFYYPQISEEYQLAYVDGKPGIELFVYIDMGERYSYQVHIDLVLQNKLTSALCVAEIKTSGMNQQEANWGNADQTAGYYAILDCLSKKLGVPFEPTVIYIVQKTGEQLDPNKDYGFHIFPYAKTADTALDFVRTLMCDAQQIDLYLSSKYFPKRGSNCVEYGRPCEFYGTCDLESSQDTSLAGEGTNYESLAMEDVDFVVDLDELLVMLEKDETQYINT